MRIEINALTFDAIIGIFENERIQKQPLIIDTAIDYRFENGLYIDYIDAVNSIIEYIQMREFELLEDAVVETAKHLHACFSSIVSITMKITKPSVHSSCTITVSETVKF